MSIVNWELSSIALDENVKAELSYQNEYTFTADMDFNGEEEINMLEAVEGTFTFTLPAIVALSSDDDIVLTITAMGEATEVECPFDVINAEFKKDYENAFSYAQRSSDLLEVSLGDYYLTDVWNEENDPHYYWMIQDIEVINWAQELTPTDGSLYALLAYMDKYGFEANISFDKEELETLEQCKGKMVFHIPTIVAQAETDVLALRLNLFGEEWEEAYDNRLEDKLKLANNLKYDEAEEYLKNG